MQKAYGFERTSRFTKSLKRYAKNDEKKRKAILKTFKLLLDNPSHPSLNLELINSRDKIWTVRINLSDRIFLSFEENNIILLIDIGSHDLYKQYQKCIIFDVDMESQYMANYVAVIVQCVTKQEILFDKYMARYYRKVMPSKNEASGFRRHALVPDFHNGGIVRTDGNASNSEPGDRPSESVAHEQVQHRGMEGAQADELIWNSGSGN